MTATFGEMSTIALDCCPWATPEQLEGVIRAGALAKDSIDAFRVRCRKLAHDREQRMQVQRRANAEAQCADATASRYHQEWLRGEGNWE